MYKVGLENNTEGRSQAWILGHPGCYAYGSNGQDALQSVPRAIVDYTEWIASHTSSSWIHGMEVEYQLDETWECYSINEDYELTQDGYEVNAWFRYDWLPLSDEDIQHGLLLLSWGRQELLKTVGNLSLDILDRTYPHERWSIAGILKHNGSAEWWYLDRLGLAFPWSDIPEDPFQRLEVVRSKLTEVLPGLTGSRQVIGLSGEFWSPRKLLRRAVWHEYDHIAHIRKLV